MPVQLLPASVVLGMVLDRICFKALQLLRCVQWGLLPGAGQSLKQPQQSFHSPILDDHIVGRLWRLGGCPLHQHQLRNMSDLLSQSIGYKLG